MPKPTLLIRILRWLEDYEDRKVFDRAKASQEIPISWEEAKRRLKVNEELQ
jgi:hypothetical protein